MIRRDVLWMAVIASIIIYAIGVGSGLLAADAFKREAQKRISTSELRTQAQIHAFENASAQQIAGLSDYVTYLRDTVSALQVEDAFSQGLEPAQRCALGRTSSAILTEQLQRYRDELPYRIEAYPTTNLSPEHAQLKAQYDSLSMRVWTLLRRNAERCPDEPKPVLYFYTSSCPDCVAQGEALDRIDRTNATVLAIDLTSTDPLVRIISGYYNITSAPALVINDHVYRGLTNTSAIREAIAT